VSQTASFLRSKVRQVFEKLEIYKCFKFEKKKPESKSKKVSSVVDGKMHYFLAQNKNVASSTIHRGLVHRKVDPSQSYVNWKFDWNVNIFGCTYKTGFVLLQKLFRRRLCASGKLVLLKSTWLKCIIFGLNKFFVVARRHWKGKKYYVSMRWILPDPNTSYGIEWLTKLPSFNEFQVETLREWLSLFFLKNKLCVN
jgi:hypothetical protein